MTESGFDAEAAAQELWDRITERGGFATPAEHAWLALKLSVTEHDDTRADLWRVGNKLDELVKENRELRAQLAPDPLDRLSEIATYVDESIGDNKLANEIVDIVCELQRRLQS